MMNSEELMIVPRNPNIFKLNNQNVLISLLFKFYFVNV